MVRRFGWMTEHLYEVCCPCGAAWRVLLEEDDDPMSTCLNCGADCFALTDIGEIRHAGREVND
jgi:predicted nucleic acid-binding Zn ribbon protein